MLKHIFIHTVYTCEYTYTYSILFVPFMFVGRHHPRVYQTWSLFGKGTWVFLCKASTFWFPSFSYFEDIPGVFWKSWLCSVHPRWFKKNPTTLGGCRGNPPTRTWQISGWWTHSAEGKIMNISGSIGLVKALEFTEIHLSSYNWVTWVGEEAYPMLTGIVQ